MDNAIALPAVDSLWTIGTSAPVIVSGVRKKGRGHFVEWAARLINGDVVVGRTPLKSWQKFAKAA